MMIRLRATERHLPYEITQCHLPLCRQVNASRLNPCQTDNLLNLPTPCGWKAELTWVAGGYTEMVYRSADSHPSK